MSDFTKETLAAAGGWAFPCHHTPEHEPGMTLRDWFAGQAIAAIAVTWRGTLGDIDDATARLTAQSAYEIADHMLAERERPRK